MIKVKLSKKTREMKRYFGDGGGIRRRVSGLSRHESAAHEGCGASIELAAPIHFYVSLSQPLLLRFLC